MVPLTPRLCLLGDQTELPNISKYDFTVMKVEVVTAAWIILRLWKSTPPPDIKKWMEFMLEIVSYEAMVNNEEGMEQFVFFASQLWDKVMLWLYGYNW